MVVGNELLLVTVGGECFLSRLRHKGYSPARSSVATFWVLEDRVWGRPSLQVAAFLPDETCWQLAEWAGLDHDLVALNGVRRAFDCAELQFECGASEQGPQKEIIVLPNLIGQERSFVADTRGRALILHTAYWVGFKYQASQEAWVDFATDQDLEYLGVDRNTIQRNVWLLEKCGRLELHPSEKTKAVPKHQLVEDYESGGAIGHGMIRVFSADSEKESRDEIVQILKATKSTLTIVDNYVLIPLKVGSDSDLNPVTDSEVKLGVFGAQRRWRSYPA
jgi:hypothetical protein